MASTPRRSWIDVQKKTFSGWANNFLKERILRIKDFDHDLRDGVLLCNLLEVIAGKKIGKFNHTPKTRFQKIENISICIKFIQNQGVKLIGIGGEDIADGSVKLTLGLLWTLILRYQIATIDADGYESPKAALLAWVRKRLAPYKVPVHDFDSSWQDGRALSALTDSMQVGILPLSTLSNDPFTDANRAMDIAEENFGIPKILDPHDLVTIPDDLSIMTYLSYFRDYVANAEKKADEQRLKLEEIRKRSADINHIFARGSGIEKEGLYANVPASFNIQACNFYGEELRSGGEVFAVKVKGKEGNEVVAPVSDKGDGSYEVKYLPLVPDEYEVEVTLNGLHIQDSPFHVHIDGATPEFTTSEGPGITQGGSFINKLTEFLIIARDSKGEKLNQGGDVFTSSVICLSSGASVPVQIEDNEDGTYSALYQSNSSGPHEVEVLLRGTPISGAPYQTVIYAATPENSYAEGPGLLDGKADRKATFTVFAVDVDGNKQTKGGEPFKLILEGQAESEEHQQTIQVEGQVKDNNDGTYTISYSPPEPGDYSVVASLYGIPISGFPKQLHFKPSANGANTQVEGTGIRNGVAERPVSLQIVAKDKRGSPRSDGGDDFRVVFEVDNETTDIPVVDNGDGTYSAEFVPSKPGDGKVHVLLDDGSPVAASPYNVYIKPLPSAKNTYATGKGLTSPFDNAPAVFTIHAVDEFGNPIKEGGDSFSLSLFSPSGDSLPHPLIVDNSNGTYTVTYHPDAPGEYEMDIRVGEGERQQSIKGFPSKVNVREGTEGEESQFLSFSFTVVAHDKRKQVKNFGGDTFKVIVKGPHKAKEIQAIDNNDGSYTGKYILEGKGKYEVKVILNGKEVAGSPFVQKVGDGKNDKSIPLLSSSAKTNFE